MIQPRENTGIRNWVGWVGICDDEGHGLGAPEYRWPGTVSLAPCAESIVDRHGIT